MAELRDSKDKSVKALILEFKVKMFLVYCFIKLGEGSQMFMVNSDCIPFMSSRSVFIWKL